MVNPDKKTIRRIFLIICWAMYDLANQFFALNVVTVYFPRWLILEKNTPEIFYSICFGFSMVVVGVCAPFLGTISDMQKKKKIYLISFTMLSVVFTILLGFADNVFLAMSCFALGNIGCQMAVVFYNALIVGVAQGRQVGLISGIGKMFGYSGAIIALYLSKPIITNYGYQLTLLMTGCVFFIFALPAMAFLKEERVEGQQPLCSFITREQLREIYQRIKAVFAKGTQQKQVQRFLKAFFYCLCTVQTLILFMAIYASKAFKLGESEVIDLIIFSTVFAIIGSVASGHISDRIGSRKAMIGVFILWMMTFLGGAFLNPPFHWVIGAIVGFALSSTWVVSRAWAIKLVPEENIGEIFGLFNLVGYIAGIVGPLFWGLVLFSLSFMGDVRYRVALLSLVIFMGFSFYHLLKIPEKVEREKIHF